MRQLNFLTVSVSWQHLGTDQKYFFEIAPLKLAACSAPTAALRSARFWYPVCQAHLSIRKRCRGSRSARRQGLSANSCKCSRGLESHPPRLSLEVIAAQIGYFVSLFMLKGRELTR